MAGVRLNKRLLFAFNRLFKRIDIKLKRSNSATRYWPECFENMKRLGFSPEVVVDVGVLTGTWELYESFKSSRFILFEPMQRCEASLQEITRYYDATYHLVAVGSGKGTAKFNIRIDDPGASSVFLVGSGMTSEVSVPMVRLDEVLKREELGCSSLLKVDVEGFELQVIEGCKNLIDCFEVIVLETRFFKYADGMAEFHEVVKRMHELGFVVYDMLDGYYRSQDAVLDLIDLVFVKENGQLRSKISESLGRNLAYVEAAAGPR